MDYHGGHDSVADGHFKSGARAEVKTETVKYKAGEVQSQGFLAYNAGITGKRTGVVIVPEWWGLTDYTRGRARATRRLGYVAIRRRQIWRCESHG